MVGDRSRAHLVENNHLDRAGRGILAPAKGVDGLSPLGLDQAQVSHPGFPGAPLLREARASARTIPASFTNFY